MLPLSPRSRRQGTDVVSGPTNYILVGSALFIARELFRKPPNWSRRLPRANRVLQQYHVCPSHNSRPGRAPNGVLQRHGGHILHSGSLLTRLILEPLRLRETCINSVARILKYCVPASTAAANCRCQTLDIVRTRRLFRGSRPCRSRNEEQQAAGAHSTL